MYIDISKNKIIKYKCESKKLQQVDPLSYTKAKVCYAKKNSKVVSTIVIENK